MSLLASRRHSRADLELWANLVKVDALNATSSRLSVKEANAIAVIRAFGETNAYVSVSWGKDSVVVAHLALRALPSIRLAWFPAGAIENPDCVLVRDAFLSRFSPPYDEIIADAHDVTYEGHDGAQEHFEHVARAYRSRYVSGVRAQESGARKLRMMTFGHATTNTCAPIGWWKHEDVFAYLHKYDLPIHPAYACLMDGLYERQHIRVGTIGGKRGVGHGRRQWEARYYGEDLISIFGHIPAHGT